MDVDFLKMLYNLYKNIKKIDWNLDIIELPSNCVLNQFSKINEMEIKFHS